MWTILAQTSEDFQNQNRMTLIGLLVVCGFIAIVLWLFSLTIRRTVKTMEIPRSIKSKPNWASNLEVELDSAIAQAKTRPTTAEAAGRTKTATAPPSRHARYCVSGVDRGSKMDTTGYYQADSEANARVKAELDGMIVTSIVRE